MSRRQTAALVSASLHFHVGNTTAAVLMNVVRISHRVRCRRPAGMVATMANNTTCSTAFRGRASSSRGLPRLSPMVPGQVVATCGYRSRRGWSCSASHHIASLSQPFRIYSPGGEGKGWGFFFVLCTALQLRASCCCHTALSPPSLRAPHPVVVVSTGGVKRQFVDTSSMMVQIAPPRKSFWHLRT